MKLSRTFPFVALLTVLGSSAQAQEAGVAPVVDETPPARPVAGYSYKAGARPAAKAKRGVAVSSKRASVYASYPTFEVAADGRTTLSFRLSSSEVVVEESASRGQFQLRIKNARIGVRNDSHTLRAEHFASPVASARLHQQGHDVLFTVQLRAPSVPVRSQRATTAEERAERRAKTMTRAVEEVSVSLEFPPAAQSTTP